MTKILIESEEIGPTAYELSKLINALSKSYPCDSRLLKASRVRGRDIHWCDIIISVRSLSSLDWRLARLAKKKGKFHILSLDDDFLGIASNYGLSGSGIWPQRQKSLRRILDYTDMIMTCNPLLGEKYTNIGRVSRFCVVNTLVSPESLVTNRHEAKANEKTKIVYYVNDGTTTGFEQFIRPVLPMLCERYGSKISLTLMALKPDISEYEGKLEIKCVEHMHFKEFREYLAKEHFDIGIAPLDGIGFSRYKYFNKFIEHSIAGIAGIYSNCEPYTFIIRNKINGILTENSPEAWLEALGQLIEDDQLRRRIVINAQKELIDDFSSEKIIQGMIKDIPELLNHSAPKMGFSIEMFWIHWMYIFFRIREYLYFAEWHLKDEGLLKLIARAVRYIKKIVSEFMKAKKITKDWKYE